MVRHRTHDEEKPKSAFAAISCVERRPNNRQQREIKKSSPVHIWRASRGFRNLQN